MRDHPSRPLSCRAVARAFLVCLTIATGLASAQDVVLTPEKVVEFAERNNTAVLSAGYVADSARWAVKGSLAAFWPTLRARASYTHLGDAPSSSTPYLPSGIFPLNSPESLYVSLYNEILGGRTHDIGPQDILDIGYSFGGAMFTSGRLLNGYRAARFGHESAKLAEQRVRQEVRLNALGFFWAYVQAQQNLKPLQETVAWVEQLLKDQIALVQAGVLVEDDMLRMKTQLSMARLGLLKAQNAVTNVGERLLLFCNLPLADRITVDTTSLDVLDAQAEPPRPVIDSVVAGRSDVQALRMQTEALACVRKTRVAAFLPILGGQLNQDFRNVKPGNDVELENAWNVAFQLEWSLLDWGRSRSDIAKVDVTLAQTNLRLDALKSAIRADVERACRALTEAMEQQRLALESVDNAQRALRNADTRYRQGVVTGTDLLAMRRELTQAQQELIAARIGKVLAMEEYRAAAGE
jgi:outer membrane protein